MLSTIKYIKLIWKKEFAAMTFNPKYEIFILYIVLLNSSILFTNSDIYPSFRPQIMGLIIEKAFMIISAKYIDFIDLFSSNLASKLPKHTGINNHAIKLINSQ